MRLAPGSEVFVHSVRFNAFSFDLGLAVCQKLNNLVHWDLLPEKGKGNAAEYEKECLTDDVSHASHEGHNLGDHDQSYNFKNVEKKLLESDIGPTSDSLHLGWPNLDWPNTVEISKK